jgi:hypothetical protein
MGLRLLRAVYGIEFLVALFATLEFWSQVGGQAHLDIMPWWWKLGISMAMAATVVKMTAATSRRKGLIWALVIVLLLLTGGFVTYYYHLHEAGDEGGPEGTLTTSSERVQGGVGRGNAAVLRFFENREAA